MTQESEIKKGIPVKGSYYSKYETLTRMDVNDCIDFFGDSRSVRVTLTNLYKYKNLRFTSRTMISDGKKFLRIWRIE